MIIWCELKASYSLLKCKTHLTLAKLKFSGLKDKTRKKVPEHQVNDSDR